MITTLLAPKPAWLTLLLGILALFVALFGGIHAGLDFWGLMAVMVQLIIGVMVLSLAVALSSQHKQAETSALSAIVSGLVCVHALALVVASAAHA